MDPASVCLLHTLLLMITLPPVFSALCPRPCSCPQPTELHCTFRSLFTIPAAVSKHVERMNLGFNSINEITDKSLAGLRKLELLMVHGNDVHSLPDGVFRDLTSLQMLKMSYNKLTEINRHTLQGLWALARLHLDHNQLEFIHPDAFQGLTSLRLLQLEGNRLQQLHPATFTTFTLMDYFHVSTLRHLYLSHNGLMSLPSHLVATMPQLENLYLHGNPWTCDCNMRWLHDWIKTSPDVLKCKKDRALPGGQLCPMCSSPKHLKRRELQAVESLVCSSPVISSPQMTPPPDNMESEVMTTEDFSEPLGNISLGLSDEHGNEVDLECSINEPSEVPEISWEQVNQLQLASNITLSVDIECPVDREKYERLWRLIAYYSNVPAHLQRGNMVKQEPHPTYVYRQDSEKDALYYTGVKVNIMAQPKWLMQTSADLQLNRLQSSAKMVKLILSTNFSETVEAELVRRQRRTWVMIESTNATRKALSAILGNPSQMDCNVQSSDRPVIQWMLPDGSKMEAPHSSPDNRVSVSGEGQLVIKAVSHTDTGIYYCIAKVHGDLAVLPFHLTVQESSSPLPGEDASITPIEGFVGNPISLPCIASGSPDAEINWILPSSNIVSFQANSSRALVFSNGTLHIPQTQLLDGGHYKCIAINQHGVDTLATKIILIRRKGLIRPLRKFPARPQSASGVNTQIKVPTIDTDEASGDNEGPPMGPPLSSLDLLRRRVPGGVATGRRGIHPSRNMWRRPQLPRKPTRSRVEDRKNIVDSRRKINMSKSKIDPEKWADILAKIRDRNAHNNVTQLLVLRTTQTTLTEQTTKSQETVEGSSDGITVQEKEGKDYLTTPHIPVLHTTNKHSTQGEDTYVISNSDTSHDTQDMTSNSQHIHNIHSTVEPHTTQTAYNVQHTSPDTNLDLQTISNSLIFLPQTTSVPLHAVTFWQANTNIASSSSTFSLQENPSTNTDVDRVKTAQWSKASEKNENVHIPNAVASSNNDRELFLSGSQIIPSDNHNGKHFLETSTRFELHTQPKDTKLAITQAMLTTAPLTTTQVPTTTRSRGSEGQSSSRLRHPNSKRKNDSRRRRPNRRKQKLNKPTQLIATTPTIAPLATVKTTTSSQLKIEALEATLASFNTTVPFRGSQAASSGRLSHEESKDQGHDAKAATKHSSLPASPPVTNDSIQALAKPLFKSTSAAPSFPMSSPGVGYGKTSSPTALRIPDSASPAERLEMFTSATQQRFTGSLVPPVKPLEETQRVSITGDLGPVPRTNNSSGGFHSVTQAQTDVGLTQSGHQYIPHENDGNMLVKETAMQFSLLPPPSASTASFIEHEIKTTSAYTSRGLITTPSMLFKGDLDKEQVTTKDPTLLETSYHTFNQNKTPSNESERETHLEETANIGMNADALITSIVTINPSVISRPDVLIPSRVAQYVTLPKMSPTGATMDPLLMGTTKETPKIHNIPDNRRQSQHFHSINTSEPQRTKDFHLVTKADHKLAPFISINPTPPFISINPTSPALKLTSGQTIKEMATPVPTIASNQTETFKEGLLTRSQNMSRKHQLPGQGSIPRGKPRITKSNFQTFTVKAETDAQLPCEAEGEPMPFLSWTKVSSGASIAQNTRVQRFEVHPNGTLIIRNTQPMDGGQYLCTVQNQYGTDKMVINLIVLMSQHHQVLQPRHSDITVHVGGKVDLECIVEGHPMSQVTWVLPNHIHMTATPLSVIPQQRVTVLSNGTLRISQASYTDRGIYKCIGSSAAGADTVSVRLYISALPPVIQQTKHENTTLREGSTAFIHCTATGSPKPVVRWITPDGVQLTASQFVAGHNLIVFPNGTLYIRTLGPGNAGRYECSASNVVASSRRTVILSIMRNPSSAKARITSSSPQRTDVIYGRRLQLNCVARGEPEPRIIWRTPSKKLVDAQYSFDPRIKVFTNGSITVQSVTDEDSGDYLCVARNKMGDDYVLLRVNVLTRPAKIKQKQQQSSQEVVYGGDLKVDCVASGLPNPKISWALPDGTMVNPVKQRHSVNGGRSRRYVVFDNGTLYLNDVGMPEEGDYTCYAENQLGKDEMKVRVTVKGTTLPPQIQDKDQKTVRVFYDKYQILDDGTLVVQKVQRFDGGNYTCMARNNAGQDHKIIRLEVLVATPVINNLSGTANNIKVTAVPDQRKFVDCVAKGIPTPRVMWVLPGNVILPAPYYSNRVTVHQNGTLEIRSPKRTDSGQLACIARNEGGEVRLVVNLDVTEVVERPPIIGPKTESLSLTVGNAMILNCSFEGLSIPHVTWLLPNGTPLQSGTRSSKFFHRPDGSLIISNPSVSEAGMYRCLGRNGRGLMERIITLSPGRKPEIVNRYNTPVSIMNGERLLLHCLTSGEPLRLSWTLPSGVVLNRPQRAGRYAVLPNGTLAIQQVSVYDRGSYVCRTANEYGSSLLPVSVIVIAYPPQITNGPPSVTYAKHGVAVQLNCVATGIPKVDVAWETPDKTRLAVSAQPRLFGNKYLHPQGSLIIQNPTQRDTGIYRCTARNTIGIDSKATFLNVF
ncbi:matrix-remodeling-associated protein 5 isoform X1 [Acanthopagrus latus]|uniref:matrix-remodeling-associated protein 5 isoform X1 n=1 Tax=Acanthopagrus latus TaxID=8177 RepID=UPI00187CECFA|nr:matrix-remodeling-associated protein 5 isoform X1 [Acanthopagrus latus]